MSKISPSELNYFQNTISDFQRAINEQEETHDKEASRAKERHRSEIESLETSNDDNISEQSREHDEALKDLRNSARRSLTNERDLHKEEIRELKHSTYDQFGRLAQEEKIDLLRQHASTQNEYNIQNQAARDRSQEIEDVYDRRIRDINESHEKELEEIVTRARDSANQSYEEAYKEESEDYLGLKEELKDKYKLLNKNLVEKRKGSQQQTAKAISDVQLEAEHRVRSSDNVAEDRIREFGKFFENKSIEDANILSKSRKEENDQLRSQLKDLSDITRQGVIGHAEGRRQAINEFERDRGFRENAIVGNYEAELKQQKKFSEDIERRFANRSFKTLRAKDLFYTDIIRTKAKETHDEKNELLRVHDQDRKIILGQVAKEKKLSSKRLGEQADILNHAREKSLKNQALAYQETLKRQRVSLQDKINQLQERNRTLKTSEDTSLLSPAAERALRKQISNENNKVLEENEERLKRTANSLRESFQNKIADTVNTNQRNMRLLQKENVSRIDVDRMTFNQYVHDITADTQEKIIDQERKHISQSENVQRIHARNTDRIERQFKDILSARQSESSSRLREIVSEAEFDKRILQRKFSNDTRAIIRSYEKKITDQKNNYETIIEDLKLDIDQSLRETEKTSRHEFETQERFYKNQIAQLDQQNKERERVMVENFEEEIEETRKANARIIRSKS